MSDGFFILASAVSCAVVAAVVLGLVVARATRLVIAAAYARERAVLEEAVRARLWHGGSDADLRGVIEAAPFEVVVDVLRAFAPLVEGRRWDELAAIARDTLWFESVLRQCRSVFWWRRLTAARCLAMVAGRTDAPHAMALVRDRCAPVRLAALRIVARVDGDDLVAAVFDEAMAAPVVTRAYLLRILRDCDRKASTHALAALEDAAEPGRLLAALDYVEVTTDPIYLDALHRLASHDDATVRERSVSVLRWFPHRRTAAVLAGRLEDTSDGVRRAACLALGEIRASSEIEAVAPLLDDPSRDVRLAAAIGLRRMGLQGVEAVRARARAAEGGTVGSTDPTLRYALALDEDALDACDSFAAAAAPWEGGAR